MFECKSPRDKRGFFTVGSRMFPVRDELIETTSPHTVISAKAEIWSYVAAEASELIATRLIKKIEGDAKKFAVSVILSQSH